MPETEEEKKSILDRLDDLEVLVRQNIQWSELTHQESKRTRRRLTMMVFGDWIRLAFWLVPLILGVIFLPPLFKQAKQLYEDMVVKPQQKVESTINRAYEVIRKSNSIVSSTIPNF